MNRIDIINALIKKNNYKSYLEIGVQNKDNCFNKIDCIYKIGVDPDINANATYTLTSDDYFNVQKVSAKKSIFDIIFIDGLHHHEQVHKDINNSLLHLSKNGIIVVHDCNPINELHQKVPRESKVWNGDVWKAIVLLRTTDNLDIKVVDTDHGIGLIKLIDNESKLDITNKLPLNFSDLEKNRKEWLNLISVNEFKSRYL